MASNESYRITPKDIVSDRILFRIPLYQRLFTWGESQVRQLMDDLRFHFKNNNDKAYYLGMITVVRQGNRLIVLPFFRPAECGFKSRISRQCEPDSSLG